MNLPLDSPAARALTITSFVAVCAALLYLVLCDFIVGALTDDRIRITVDAAPAGFITAPFTDHRVGVNPAVLDSAVRFLPNSSRLHMRLVEFERQLPGVTDWRPAESHATRAALLSPYDYRPRLQLGWIRETEGELTGAEQAARAALKLAGMDFEPHFQLATVLISRGSLAESFKEFRSAAAANPDYLAMVFNLVWTQTRENVDALRASTPDTPQDRLALARFLFEQSRPLESAAVFRQIDREALLSQPESGRYLDDLLVSGYVKVAHELWRCTLNHEGLSPCPLPESEPMWNGGFENDILVDFAQFDWTFQASKYATVSIDRGTAHTGKRSLRIDFLGHETTRLENEIKQLLLLEPGVRYRVCYHSRTENLTAPEGPQVVVTTKSGQWIGTSDPAPEGTHDWKRDTFEFTASSDILFLAIQQKPKFSYEPPTRGTIWFDHFEIQQIP